MLKKIDIKVLSRADVESSRHYNLFTSKMDKHIVISITSSKEHVEIPDHHKRLGAIFLNFDDIDWQTETENTKAITDRDVENILIFVNKYIKDIDGIVVHCDAGISRSAGVAASLNKILHQEDDMYFKNYIPNMRVYSSILNDYYKNEGKDCVANIGKYVTDRIVLDDCVFQ